MKRIFIVSFYLITFSFSNSVLSKQNDSAQPNTDMVKQWNDFVTNIYQLHNKLIDTKNIKTSARSGSYHELPYYFQEIRFSDADTGLAISKLEWETKNPDKLHAIEVYVRDENNKIIREYFASYLPTFRNAPYQTLINLHHYDDNLHSFRQYDASNNLIYEVCHLTDIKKKIYEHDDFEIPDNFKQGIGKEKNYQRCFSALSESGQFHLQPR